ncbi:M48 family metallopeptidase [Pseudoduganella namucuonensis]|uniref:Zn-dependent protease with chaperone function n=1 Tax=Pseudoduganella namucuonensis TaxID=1035707 RepID=A0A1I7LKA1_9BURK|nr:M48 family metallopeptidase [Pseudoduganella namucuonensis]SFV10116.1 Zn-dependent protease with chaperone function [Pseudoduganella namucuonensis]
MDAIHAGQSAALIEQLARPSPSYKRSARLAVAGLLGFVLLYFLLAGWFAWTAYRLALVAYHSNQHVLWTGLAAFCSAFFGAFMLKAIFSIRSSMPEGLAEVTAKEQPRLFAFLHALADAAGAPRPHRVFLSNRVNAAVFYDLSLLNLIFPSKKNLEIGLPLVNALPLGELRAVLAHEFGHFAQRSMAVGRWVYVAQQIAMHLVSRRDRFDAFLDGLGRIDLRLRVLAWAPKLVVWSIRSLVESAFHVVVLMQSALSREMEMQADLVAVSLTGSDALVHALHRLRSADDAWSRALGFVHGERAEGRATRDAYAVQSHITQRMAAILDDPSYGAVPPLPERDPEAHRLFKAELAQPPRMWQTHPLNHEREANAKRLYVPAPIDQASAWSLFSEPVALRERMSARLLDAAGPRGDGAPELADTELEASLRKLGTYYRREQFNRRYCGVYFGRALARHAASHRELADQLYAATPEEAAAFYPLSLKDDVRQARMLADECGQLEALVAGAARLSGGSVQLRGVDYRRKELPAALARARGELAAVEGRLRAHDRLCRSWHQAMAARMEGGWQPYLDGLLALLHYVEHTEANLRDAHGLLLNAASVVTAIRHVTDEGVVRVVSEANQLHYLLGQVYKQREALVLDTHLVARLELEGNWKEMLGEFGLPLAGRENINQWMGAIDGWVGHATGALTALRGAALEQLLLTETLIARHVHLKAAPRPAPAPSRVPYDYARLAPGDERKRQTRLGAWARFLRADGVLPGAARLAVAGGVVAAALGAGMLQTDAVLTVYNGLGVPVRVTVDGRAATVGPFSHRELPVAPQESHRVAAHTASGALIEEFDSGAGAGGSPVYNVAAAGPMVEWTASYGRAAAVPDRRLGAPRWLGSRADVLFGAAPKSISAKGGGTRTVLEGAAALAPSAQLDLLPDDAERRRVTLLHARWDDTRQPYTAEWLARAIAADSGQSTLLARRLREAPGDVALLRLEQDAAGGEAHAAVCLRHEERARAAPDDPDLAYLALRCAPEGEASRQGYRDALRRWPAHPWLRNAVAYEALLDGDFAAAAPHLDAVRTQLPQLAAEYSLTLARIQRLQRGTMDYQALAPLSPRLRQLSELEEGYGPQDTPTRAYAQLNRGALAAAMAFTADTPAAARMLRLAAASDGAGPDTIRRALALKPDQGIDEATVWTSVALALRHGASPEPYMEAAGRLYGPEQPRVRAFLDAVRRGSGQAEAEALLRGAQPEVRMLAYSAALVLAGERAPADWRLAGKRLLFAPERPYFR